MKRLNFNPFADEQPPPAQKADVIQAPAAVRNALDSAELDRYAPVTIAVPGYGGVTVRRVTSSTEAMLRVLDVLVQHREKADESLVAHAVLLEQLPKMPTEGFCIRRQDHWTLAVPEAQNRSQALLQIVQALLQLARGPLATVFRNEGIQPYRE